MDELVAEFLTETNESLDELDVDIVNLEQNPNDADLLGKIFRLVHTIKGTCGFLALPRLEKVAHHGENVLGRFRDGDLEVIPEYVTLIFECIDQIKYMVGEIEATGAEPEGDDAELIEKLDAVYEGRDASQGGGDAPAVEAAPVEAPASGGYPGGPTGNVSQAELDALEAAFNDTPGPADANTEEADDATAEDPVIEAAPEPELEVALETQPETQKADTTPTAKKGPSLASQSLRVNVDVLENLMTMVSELVLTRNQLMQIQRASSGGATDFTAPLQSLNLVVSDLQEGVMKTRMQPIGNAWAKLPRIIRDLSMELDKKIELEMIGQDTELDRQVLELIKDPLTHMVRNSGDHGIEDPATRKTKGKPETGKIILEAFHEGGHIIIQIKDDGKGLPMDLIKKKIIGNGLASADELADMPDQQIQQFIFKAGFSTAEKVTSVSGRGVGMDVVRTNIEKIGGSIELNSREGFGSTFTIKIPLTLAIVSALIVESAGEKFAIPQLSVKELVMASNNGESKIETIKGAPVYRLRDNLLPLVSLHTILKMKKVTSESIETLVSDSADDTMSDIESGDDGAVTARASRETRNSYIVVSNVGNFDFGIIVDRVFDTEEIVVKPVAKMLRDIELFSGNTILGDGSVIMILDPNGIARQAGELDSPPQEAQAEVQKLSSSHEKTSLLLFSAGDAAPKAVPLSLVARLEHVDFAKVEHSSGKMMVQYRGQLMPLIPFNSSVQVDTEGQKPVLVFADRDQSMGLIVDDIIDIKEEFIDVQLSGDDSGLFGSAIIDNKATDVVDIAHFLSSINKDWFKNHGDENYEKHDAHGEGRIAHQNGAIKSRVLLVDDSSFFRNMLTPVLSIAGYDVTSLDSPLEALKLCEGGACFDIIVSDIEMPDMDGFEFAEKVRGNTPWVDTPMVALSSHATPKDIDRGIAVGFNQYVAKFDRDTLLNAMSETLSDIANARSATQH